MTEPSQYFKGRTVQEQMNEVIGYVDVRSAEVSTDAIAADVAQVHQDMLDADADATAAAASAAAAAGTLANAVKKTGEASQSIAGDIVVAGDLSGGTVTVPTPVNNTDAASKKYVDDQDALDVHLAGNQTVNDVKTFSSSPVVPTEGTGTFSTKAANSTKVKNELDNYETMVRTGNNQTISAVKQFTGAIQLPCVYDNKVTQNNENTSTWRRVYINNVYNAANQMLLVCVTPQKPAINPDEYGILLLGGTNTSPLAKWIVKGSAIVTNNFVCVNTVTGYLEVWVKNASGNNGLSFVKMHETSWGSVANNWSADSSTVDASFDYTDTTKYSAYTVSS